MQTEIKKSKYNGWEAVTRYDLGDAPPMPGYGEGRRVLEISTSSNPGSIFTSARALIIRGSARQYAIGGDFTKPVFTSPCKRATEKAIRQAHEIATPRFTAIVDEAKAFYAAKALPVEA